MHVIAVYCDWKYIIGLSEIFVRVRDHTMYPWKRGSAAERDSTQNGFSMVKIIQICNKLTVLQSYSLTVLHLQFPYTHSCDAYAVNCIIILWIIWSLLLVILAEKWVILWTISFWERVPHIFQMLRFPFHKWRPYSWMQILVCEWYLTFLCQ